MAATPVGDYPVLWSAEDSRTYAVAIPMAINRAYGLDPQTGATPPGGAASLWKDLDPNAMADLRVLAVVTVSIAGQLSTTPPGEKKDKKGGTVLYLNEPGPGDFDDADRKKIAGALLATFGTITQIAQMRGFYTGNIPTKFATFDGAVARPGEANETVQAGWIQAAAVVVGCLAVSGAVAYTAYQVSSAVKCISMQATFRMLATQAQLLENMHQHALADAVAGKRTPMTPDELRLADQLLASQKAAQDGEAASLKASGGGGGFGALAKDATWLIVGLAAAWFFISKGR